MHANRINYTSIHLIVCYAAGIVYMVGIYLTVEALQVFSDI